MNEKELKEFYQSNNIKTTQIAKINQKMLNKILISLEKHSLPYQLLFQQSHYTKSLNILFNDDQKIKNFLLSFFSLLNYAIKDFKGKNDSIVKFLIIILCKIYKELGSKHLPIEILEQYFLKINDIENILNYFYISENKDKIFENFVIKIPLIDENIIRIRDYILNNNKPYKLLCDFVSFSDNYNNSIEFIAKIFKWNFNMNLFFLLYYKEILPGKKDDLIKIKNNIKLLQRIFELEEEEYSQKENKEIIINGLLIKNSFYLNKPFTLNNIDDYYIKFSFAYFKNIVNSDQNILSLSLEKDESVQLNFEIIENYLIISIQGNQEQKIKLVPYEVYDIYLCTNKSHSFFQTKYDTKLRVNQSEFTLKNNCTLKDKYIVKIGPFFGEIGEIIIDTIKKDETQINSMPLLKISPLLIYEKYKINSNIKEFPIISFIENNFKLCRKNITFNKFTCDIPFEKKVLKNEFEISYGYEYLCLVMNIIYHKADKDNIIDVYECLNVLFSFVFEVKLHNEKNIYKFTTLLYYLSILLEKIYSIQRIPETFILLLLNYIEKLKFLNSHNSCINKIYMILMNPKNYNLKDFNMHIILDSFTKNLNLIKKQISNNRPYLIFYLKVLVDFYWNAENKTNIPNLIVILLEKLNSELVSAFLYQIQSIIFENKNGDKLRKAYKLLKLFYLSVPEIKINDISQNYNILMNFYQIILLLKSNDKKYANYLKCLSIRCIDDYYITKYNKNIKISYNTINKSEENTNELIGWKQILDKIIDILDGSITPEMLKSFLLISFNTTNTKNTIKFFQSKLVNNDNQSDNKIDNLINYENLVSNSEQISSVFFIVQKIYSNKYLLQLYLTFFKSFFNYSLLNIKNCVKLFQNPKIFVDIFYNIILTKVKNNDIIIYEYEEIALQMEEVFKEVPDPFYFKLIEILNIKIIHDCKSENIQNLEDNITYKYFIHLTETLLRIFSFDPNKNIMQMEKSKNLKTKNFILLISSIMNKMYSDIPPSSIEGHKLIEKVFTLYKQFINNNSNNSLIYCKTIFKQKSIIEIIFDDFIEEIKMIETLSKDDINKNKNIKDIMDLLRKLIFPTWKPTNKIKHTIFYKMDISKKKGNSPLKESDKIDREFLELKEGTTNIYLFTLVFLKKILMLKSTINPQLSSLFEEMQSKLISDINKNYKSKLIKKFVSETKSKSYNYFKRKIDEEILSEKSPKGKTITIDFLNKIIEELNNHEKKSNLSKEAISNKSSVTSEKISTNNTSNDTIKNPINVTNLNNLIKDTKLEQIFLFQNEYDIINNIDIWYQDIEEYGVLSLHKIKNFLLKGIFAIYNIKEFYQDSNFSHIVQRFYKYIYNEYSSQRVMHLKFPCKIKNYITKNFTKPFLKLDRKIYTQKTFIVSHNYIDSKFNLNRDNTIKNNIIKMHFDKSKKFEGELIVLKGSILVDIYITDNCIIIQSSDNWNIEPKKKNLFSSNKYINENKHIIILFKEIEEIIIRRFLFNDQALEISLNSKKVYFLNLFSKEKIQIFLIPIIKANTKFPFSLIENPKIEFFKREYIKQWQSHSLSTFNLLNYINKYSSRTFNDLNQYPIFPWIFADYSSKSKLENSTNIRKFELPISLQTEEKLSRFESLIIEYKKDKETNRKPEDKFEALQNSPHLNVHYSIAAFVYFYLVRLSPITECHIDFQSGNFDSPNRMFIKICDTKNILEQYSDNRELLPEFFYLSEMYYNMNLCSLGIKNEHKINNVIIPDGFDNATEYIYFNRNQLENNININRNLAKWIDNIFGVEQYQIDKKRFYFNVFQWQTYEDLLKEKYEKCLKKQKIEEFIDDISFALNFGQCPSQLLNSPMSSRKPPQEIYSLLNSNNIKQKISSNNKSKEDFSYSQQFKLKEILIDNKTEIKHVLYTKKYIIIITSDNKLIIYNKRDFTKDNVFSLSDCFNYITPQCLFEYEIEVKNNTLSSNKTGNPTIICGNFLDRTIRVFSTNIKKKCFNINHVISVFCKVSSNIIYTGTTNGILSKWKLSHQKGELHLTQISSNIQCHLNNQMITSIKYIHEYECIITTGNDHYIFIRNSSTYELITSIQLMNNNNNIQSDLFISKYNIIYYFDNTNNKVDVYTVNGMKVCEERKGIDSKRTIMIDGGNRMMYIDKETNKIIELAPLNVNKIVWELNIDLIEDKEKIERGFYDKEIECIDLWMNNKSVIRVYLKKENRILKKKIRNLKRNEGNENRKIDKQEKDKDEIKVKLGFFGIFEQGIYYWD